MRAVLEEKKNNCLLLSATLPALYIPTPWKWTLDTWTHLEGPEVTDHMTPSPDHMADNKSKPMTDPRTNPMTHDQPDYQPPDQYHELDHCSQV